MMKNKLLAITFLIVVLSPLALIFSLTALSPFESMVDSQNSLTVFEKALLGPLQALDTEAEDTSVLDVSSDLD